MQARDIMTADVISVRPEASVRHIAQLMLQHRISAVPVIDEGQGLVGIVSEGDLLHRPEIGATRPLWWLGLLDCPEAEALDYVKTHGKQAQDVMTADVITVGADTPIARVAALLHDQVIKRVPVVEQGRVIGIVSRADLVHAVAAAAEDQTAPGDEALQLAIATRLREEAGFRDGELSVTVSDGIVHLGGKVCSAAKRQAAGVAVWSVRGVKGLVDHTEAECGAVRQA